MQSACKYMGNKLDAPSNISTGPDSHTNVNISDRSIDRILFKKIDRKHKFYIHNEIILLKFS